MKILKTVLLCVGLLVSGMTSAHAMGDRERGALIGAGAVLLLPSLIEGAGNLFGGTPQRNYTTTHYVEEPRPRVVYTEPYVRERVIIIDNTPRHRYESPRYERDRSYYHSYDRDRYYR
ncbi:hypothetical protein [Sulfurospirillum barnesii]|uniref:Uncharacterized protein n=1 Tax=Sulfurospirillum barnesii (strain ATCC 700032 / DSM 10660 / SES-3) TaxID=760154 RepID=I3XU34_SULBS|nr:hypothetical protein [Sulfurospirillum barnesii]AFL67458.1 hypothetical protein Sulba_0131 [Sulfurospirillum barnesii SES-3]